MRSLHIHKPQWHVHKPEWHTLTLRLEHLIRDPRFWAVVALVALFGLMILMITISEPGTGVGPRPLYPYPMYPYTPYMP